MEYKNKFETIRDELIQNINDGIYAPGEQITEKALTLKYGVNRGTINKVISAVASNGLVTRKPRVGTVVLDVKERAVSSRLGVFVVRSSGHLFGNMFSLLAGKIQKHHYFPLLVDLDMYSREEETLDHVETYLERAVTSSPEFILIDGMSCFPFKFLKELSPKPRNLIFINRCETPIKFDATYILSDYEKGGYMGAEHLLQAGHKNILVVTQSCTPYGTNGMRLSGVKKAFIDRGLEFTDGNIRIYHTSESLEKEVLQRFAVKKPPSALFVFSDSEARTIQRILERNRIFLKKDYDMVGYFNTPWAEKIDPQITSVSINETELAELFEKVITEKLFPRKTMQVDPILVVRNQEKVHTQKNKEVRKPVAVGV